MPYRARRIIDIVVRNNDFLRKIVYILERAEFPLIRFLFGYAVRNLHVILLRVFARQKIDFFAVVFVYVYFVTHINQFVIDDIFKVVRNIVTVVHTAYRVETNVHVVYFNAIG